MSTKILASTQGDYIRLALTEDAKLVEYTLWNPDVPDGVGDLYTGRVAARATAMGGVFVDLGAGQTGFLPDSAGGKSWSDGDLIGVRVTRAAQGGKGPRLAGDRSITPGHKAGLVAIGPGPLVDFHTQYPESPIIVDSYALLARLRNIVQNVVYGVHCLDPHEDEIAELESHNVMLPAGARATIIPTPALTAIDIDAGASTAERAHKSVSQARLNRTIIPELARQIRLRNLGGAILIDFAGMRPAARASLAPELHRAFAGDPLRPRLLGFSCLGFAEIVRPRIRQPLHELLLRIR